MPSTLSTELILVIGTLFSVLAICNSAAHAAQVTLEWDPALTSDLAGYKVYYGTSSEMYDVTVDVGHWTSCTIDGLEDDETYYFTVTAYSKYGEESDFSEEVDSNSANAGGDGGGGGGGCFIDAATCGLRRAN